MTFKFLFFIFFVTSFFKLLSQNINSISYFDKKGNLTYIDSSLYYRQESSTEKLFRSFYTKTKKLYFEGTIINANDTLDAYNSYKGLCKWYYPTGIIKRNCNYDSVGNLNGLCEEFHEDGSIFKKTFYENNKPKNKEYVVYSKNDKNGTRVFEDFFSDNLSNWNLTQTEFLSSKIKIGGLELTNRTNTDYAITIPYKIDSLNFSFETTINSKYLTPVCKSGLVFGYKNNLNYNYFYVSKFRYFIGIVRGGIEVKKIDNYFSSAINGNELNKLELKCVNDSFYYFINNKLLTYCEKSELVGNKIGFLINNGASFFDNLVIRQSNKQRDEKIKTDDFVKINDFKFQNRISQSGIMLNSNGFVYTSIKDIYQYNNIIIEAIVNDTLKSFAADLFIKDEFRNFVILKIRNQDSNVFYKPYYSYSYINTLENQKLFTIKYLFKDSITNTFIAKSINGENKKITNINGNTNSKLTGAPIFDSKGNMIGVVTSINDQLKVDDSPSLWIMTSKLNLNETNQIQKKELKDYPFFEKEIYKNSVIIHVF